MDFNINFIILLSFSTYISSVFAIGNLLLNSGPSCSVTSLIPGTPNQSIQSMKGTCYSTLTCRQQGGVPIGRCGVNNVCCVFPRTCGGIAAHNSTYFTNPGYPSSFNSTNICTLTIHRVPGVNRICQLRLDFVDFELVRPNNGNCESDRFMVSGHNLNSVVPQICGYNTGHHMYIDVDGVQGPFILNVRTDGPGQRRWNILVSQIECMNPSRAPPNCLQYFTGPTGQIMSFNYELLQQSNVNPPNQPSDYQIQGVGYMNNLDYTICFRKEQFYCSQSYSIYNNSSLTPTLNDQTFNILNPGVPEGSAGTGLIKCPQDYLLLNGMRLCGYRLNSYAVDRNIGVSDTVIDEGSGPFLARFVSNDRESGRGFKLNFKQNPCVTVLQSPQISVIPQPGRRYGSPVRETVLTLNSLEFETTTSPLLVIGS